MILNNIPSSELPEIDVSIKECINFGQWLLFKSQALEHQAKDTVFYLKAGTNIFGLDKTGKVLETLKRENLSVQIDELFYFSDVAQPHSLSNMTAAVR